MTPRRPYLVVVRAGDRSLHPQWLAQPQRSFDLAVSAYGRHPERYVDQYDLLHVCPGSKWQGLHAFLQEYADLLPHYRYVWFPDDDLLTTGDNIDQFFKCCDALNLVLAQPALTRYSHWSWRITLQQPGLVCRHTNFVEVMAPCFRIESFAPYADTFAETVSGWGLEWVWRAIAERQGQGQAMAIIDQTPVHHTRPVGAAGHGGAGHDPMQESAELLARYGLRRVAPVVLGQYPQQAARST
jgi:hypothetical protein